LNSKRERINRKRRNQTPAGFAFNNNKKVKKEREGAF